MAKFEVLTFTHKVKEYGMFDQDDEIVKNWELVSVWKLEEDRYRFFFKRKVGLMERIKRWLTPKNKRLK